MIPASLMIGSHLAISVFRKSPVASGVKLERVSMVRSDRRFCTDSMAMTLLVASFIACTTAGGVPVGAKIMCQV